ncbi:MAG: AraC family transcriptional regulator ligand-binding domain-containing protein [Proteobacteria bacterium]|nr:AraC family transcriptional regulator ligand-binding domain-containing protein [Pseudomonadota bacterium]
MKQAKLERVLMPNTYVKHVAQEFSDHERLTTGSGIPADALLTYAEPVSVAQHLQIIRNALELSGRSDWYFAWGRRMAEHFHGPITLAWLSAPTLGAGLDTFLKFIPSRVPYHRWSGQVEGAEFVCEVRELIDLGPVRVTLVEIPLLVMHEYVRTIRPGPMQGARIELKYPPPEHAAVYGEWYGCEVRFNAPRNALVIPAAWRAVHNMGHDEGTWTTSLRHCEVLCAITEDKDTLTSVRRMLFNRFERPLGERVIESRGSGGGPASIAAHPHSPFAQRRHHLPGGGRRCAAAACARIAGQSQPAHPGRGGGTRLPGSEQFRALLQALVRDDAGRLPAPRERRRRLITCLPPRRRG